MLILAISWAVAFVQLRTSRLWNLWRINWFWNTLKTIVFCGGFLEVLMLYWFEIQKLKLAIVLVLKTITNVDWRSRGENEIVLIVFAVQIFSTIRYYIPIWIKHLVNIIVSIHFAGVHVTVQDLKMASSSYSFPLATLHLRIPQLIGLIRPRQDLINLWYDCILNFIIM